jgi:hypothetical protein
MGRSGTGPRNATAVRPLSRLPAHGLRRTVRHVLHAVHDALEAHTACVACVAIVRRACESLRPAPRRGSAHPSHICARTGLAPAAYSPGVLSAELRERVEFVFVGSRGVAWKFGREEGCACRGGSATAAVKLVQVLHASVAGKCDCGRRLCGSGQTAVTSALWCWFWLSAWTPADGTWV